jgi:hypothetical protein
MQQVTKGLSWPALGSDVPQHEFPGWFLAPADKPRPRVAEPCGFAIGRKYLMAERHACTSHTQILQRWP